MLTRFILTHPGFGKRSKPLIPVRLRLYFSHAGFISAWRILSPKLQPGLWLNCSTLSEHEFSGAALSIDREFLRLAALRPPVIPFQI